MPTAVLLFTTLLLGTSYTSEVKGQSKCELCRVVFDGFIKGLAATQGSNFGGGNTKWEEKYLGKYIASETRFVEISEKFVCQDAPEEKKCHMMFEENEAAVEDWWFRHFADGASPDSLFSFLCVDQAKVCCPNNAYGKHCAPCPGIVVVDETTGKEESCSGNGMCQGNGTRSGTGVCKCSAGYHGSDCASCAESYFEGLLSPLSLSADGAPLPSVSALHRRLTCSPCHQSCTNSCRHAGPTGCHQCKDGWMWQDDATGCTDVDECETTKCKENEFCENFPGSHSCKPCSEACATCFGVANNQCLSCAAGYRMGDSGASSCSDVDECDEVSDTSPCSGGQSDPLATVCVNTPGAYICECQEGYTKHPETSVCTTDSDLQQEKERVSRNKQPPSPEESSTAAAGDSQDESGAADGHQEL